MQSDFLTNATFCFDDDDNAKEMYMPQLMIVTCTISPENTARFVRSRTLNNTQMFIHASYCHWVLSTTFRNTQLVTRCNKPQDNNNCCVYWLHTTYETA